MLAAGASQLAQQSLALSDRFAVIGPLMVLVALLASLAQQLLDLGRALAELLLALRGGRTGCGPRALDASSRSRLVRVDLPASYVRRQRTHGRGALDRGDSAVRTAGYVVGRQRRLYIQQRLSPLNVNQLDDDAPRAL